MSFAIVTPCLASSHVTTQTKQLMREAYEAGVRVVLRERCSNLPKARSVITFELLAEHDAVLWLDADVTAEDPSKLLLWAGANQHKRQVSVGAYPQKGGEEGLAVFWIPKESPAEPFQVESAGAGCMLIPRGVAEAVGKPLPQMVDKRGRWYKPIFHPILEPPLELGEDISFCRRCASAGIPVIADPTLNLGHVRSDGKTIDWTRDYL